MQYHMKKISVLILFIFFINCLMFSQIAVNKDGSLPDNSAMLDIESNSGGFLPPRFTLNQRDAIQNPAEGLMVYCTNCGSGFSGAVSVYINGHWRLITAICPFPDSPAAGIHNSTATQITWEWESAPGVSGYKWNITNDYTSAIDMGPVTSKTETGLTCNTTYFRYVWAYHICGFSIPTVLTQTTSACFTCGTPITVNHVAGATAPVNKTVTYGTVTNIPGQTAKCWITRNLGASQQGTTVNDATEASAGWYWQFNRKQGYKVEGSVRTPNTAWIDFITENSNWLAVNDPCALELGMNWRIPTYTEWTSVDASGAWTNWNGPWNSALKMHAAGYLEDIAGSLMLRGSRGFYWSGSQFESGGEASWLLSFRDVSCSMAFVGKARGFSIRCLREAGSVITTPTVSTAQVLAITQTSATSGGDVIFDGGATITARGICWSTSSNPTIADIHTTDGTGTGTFSSNLTGLAPNTPYYLRAYATNSAGTAYGNEVPFTTLSYFTCGSSLTINHIAGAVAPVDKTVTYGTAGNIPGSIKCWITSNLGADHQANAVNDATEGSAGWYWQFNRKQGYRHDGSVRTPGTVWLNPITESIDWLAVNDPCTIELGRGWRIPTYAEWNNVRTGNGWTNWNGPWNSGLKLHAAGYLRFNDGSLDGRGTYGSVWSSKQFSPEYGWYFYFTNGSCNENYDFKAFGWSVRCIRD